MSIAASAVIAGADTRVDGYLGGFLLDDVSCHRVNVELSAASIRVAHNDFPCRALTPTTTVDLDNGATGNSSERGIGGGLGV